MDAMEMIDKQLFCLKQALDQLVSHSDWLYEKKLDMIVRGKSADQINAFLLAEWLRILSQLREEVMKEWE